MNKKITGVGKGVLACIILLCWVGSAQAAFTLPALNIAPGYPDIQSPTQVDVNYVYDSITGIGTLTAIGGLSQLNLPPTQSISGGIFNLNATIDTNTSAVSGSVTLNGTSAPYGDPLLTGTLSQFGTGNNDPLEFLFTGLGGSLASLFGNSAAVILNNTGFAGTLDADFGTIPGSLSASANTAAPAAVPEPGPLAMMILGGMMLTRWSSRKNQRSTD